MNVLGNVSKTPITVYNRCFNNNKGSAKFYVDGKLAAYTKVDQFLYSCTDTITHQFEYDSTLRVLNADKSLLASTNKLPSTSSTTTFRDSSNVAVATVAPAAKGPGFDITILQSGSAAASPLVLLAAVAFAQFTSSGNDECNGFVLAGGIVDIVLLCMLVAYAAYSALQLYRKRHTITTKYYEPNSANSNPIANDYAYQPGPAKYSTDNWAAHDYRRDHASASAPPADTAPHQLPHFAAPPTHPPPAAVFPSNSAVLIQFDNAPSIAQTNGSTQHPGHAAVSNPMAPPLAHFPTAPASPSAMTYWEGQDLREKLAPVGYMKLKRYLTLHDVNCGNTLLKDELVTLAIFHRGRIDLRPLISDV
jgi:hypothetical protein